MPICNFINYNKVIWPYFGRKDEKVFDAESILFILTNKRLLPSTVLPLFSLEAGDIEDIDPPSPTWPGPRRGMIQGRSFQNPKTNPKLRQKGKNKRPNKQRNKGHGPQKKEGHEERTPNNTTKWPKGTRANGRNKPPQWEQQMVATNGKKGAQSDKTGATKRQTPRSVKRPQKSDKTSATNGMGAQQKWQNKRNKRGRNKIAMSAQQMQDT